MICDYSVGRCLAEVQEDCEEEMRMHGAGAITECRWKAGYPERKKPKVRMCRGCRPEGEDERWTRERCCGRSSCHSFRLCPWCRLIDHGQRTHRYCTCERVCCGTGRGRNLC